MFAPRYTGIMATPKPLNQRYCPLADRNHLPIAAMVLLPQYRDQFKFVAPIQRCLCTSMAYREQPCDPDICTPQLVEGLTWALTTKRPVAAIAGVSKKIYRGYLQQTPVPDESAAWEALVGDLFGA